MSKKRYLPQHRVFFIATLALFPEKLNGYAVNPWFYKPYFISEELEIIKIELEDYKNAGYLKYKDSDGLYEISDIDSHKALADLTEYLEKWKNKQLTIDSADMPPDVTYQKELLLNAVIKAYSDHYSEPRITLEKIYGSPDSYAYDPPYWELVLSYQLLDKKVEIKDLGYDRHIDGLYDDNPQPYVEYKITDKKLIGLIEQRITQKAKPEPPTVPASIVTTAPESAAIKREGRVVKDGRFIYIMIIDDKSYLIKRLDKGGTYDRFMDYVLDEDNADIDISLKEIQAQKGLGAAENLGFLARYSGFVKPFKKAFFTTSGKEKIHFQRNALLDNGQIEAVKMLAKKV
jgi:hypothetical protein